MGTPQHQYQLHVCLCHHGCVALLRCLTYVSVASVCVFASLPAVLFPPWHFQSLCHKQQLPICLFHDCFVELLRCLTCMFICCFAMCFLFPPRRSLSLLPDIASMSNIHVHLLFCFAFSLPFLPFSFLLFPSRVCFTSLRTPQHHDVSHSSSQSSRNCSKHCQRVRRARRGSYMYVCVLGVRFFVYDLLLKGYLTVG